MSEDIQRTHQGWFNYICRKHQEGETMTMEESSLLAQHNQQNFLFGILKASQKSADAAESTEIMVGAIDQFCSLLALRFGMEYPRTSVERRALAAAIKESHDERKAKDEAAMCRIDPGDKDCNR